MLNFHIRLDQYADYKDQIFIHFILWIIYYHDSPSHFGVKNDILSAFKAKRQESKYPWLKMKTKCMK